MIDYADTTACLRATILGYFGDAAARERCDSCGNCRPCALDAYERDLVRKVLSGIARAGERYGRHRIVAMLLGEVDDLPPALRRLSTTGLLRHETPEALRGWIDAATEAGLIVISWRFADPRQSSPPQSSPPLDTTRAHVPRSAPRPTHRLTGA